MNGFASIATVAARYDGFILDLWGVIHDGVQPYPGAIDCLRQLRRAGKRCVLLSNAPRRAWAVEAMLSDMGIGPDLYDATITSGEAVYLALRDRSDPWFASLGTRAYHLGPDRDRNVLDGLDVALADTPADAHFVLNTGPDDHRAPTDAAAFEDILQDCSRHALPMVCANPDLEVIRGGVRVICAGALALRYEQMGGAVRSLGKPDPAIYQPVMTALGTPKAKTLAVGDSLRTDIAGARHAAIDACWVLGGIHGEQMPNAAAAADEATRAGLAPVAMVRTFTW